MKIVCVCGFGLGSSVIAKINLENILSNKQVDAEVDTVDVGSINGIQADYFITTAGMIDSFPSELREKTLVLNNFVNQAEMEKAVEEIIARS